MWPVSSFSSIKAQESFCEDEQLKFNIVKQLLLRRQVTYANGEYEGQLTRLDVNKGSRCFTGWSNELMKEKENMQRIEKNKW